MSIISTLLSIYFALQLGIAGLAKLDTLNEFEFNLRQHKILPSQVIPILIHLFPVIEIIVAFLLLLPYSGWSWYIALLNCGIFSTFLIYKFILAVTKPNSFCGCGGVIHKRVDMSNLLISGFLVLLALLHLWLTLGKEFISWHWQLVNLFLFIMLIGWLSWQTIRRRRIQKLSRRSI
jgi:hypothetical protein